MTNGGTGGRPTGISGAMASGTRNTPANPDGIITENRNDLSLGRARTQGGAHPRHIALSGGGAGHMSGRSTLEYTAQSQPNLDGNSVDLDRERANFVDNSVRYEATLRFINGSAKTILSAIQGQ